MRPLIEEIRSRFDEARAKAAKTEALAPNSYGAGFDRGYSDALGELLEYLTEKDAPTNPYKLGKEWCPVCHHDDGAHDATCRYAMQKDASNAR